jgi:hypothetical protein
MAGKYTGFDRLKGEMAKRPGVKDPAGLAAVIGAKKYGKRRFQQHAARGESFRPK